MTYSTPLPASFLLDVPILLPLLGMFIVFLATKFLAKNVKHFAWIAVIVFGYLPAWCFRRYCDFSIVLDLLTALFVMAVVWSGTTESKPTRSQKIAITALPSATLLLFWILSGALYYNVLNLGDLIGFNIGVAGQGNHFMWNSGLDWLLGWHLHLAYPTYATSPLWDAVAHFIFFVLYPSALILGMKMGKFLFGRSEKQTGVMGLVPIPFFKSRVK